MGFTVRHEKGHQVGYFRSRSIILTTSFYLLNFSVFILFCCYLQLCFLFYLYCFLIMFLIFDEFADKYSVILNLNLVNGPDLTKILKVKIFVHKDGQLRAAHLILSYYPISSSFQAPRYVIKATDIRLHQINIVVLGFLDASLVPEGVQQALLPFQHMAEEEVTPSQLAIKDEEQVVEVLDSMDDFEVFNQPQSPKAPAGDFSHLPPA